MASSEKLLEKLLERDLPPYLVFVLAATVLVYASVHTGHYFRETWAFLLYSVIGMMWRYAEKDIRSIRTKKTEHDIQSVRAKGKDKDEKRDQEVGDKIESEELRIEREHRYLYHLVNLVLFCLFVGYLIVSCVLRTKL